MQLCVRNPTSVSVSTPAACSHSCSGVPANALGSAFSTGEVRGDAVHGVEQLPARGARGERRRVGRAGLLDDDERDAPGRGGVDGATDVRQGGVQRRPGDRQRPAVVLALDVEHQQCAAHV